jgi:hypothetical protein
MWFWILKPLSTIFQYIVPAGFIGGRNQHTRRKPPTCCKSLVVGVVARLYIFVQHNKVGVSALIVLISKCISALLVSVLQIFLARQ